MTLTALDALGDGEVRLGVRPRGEQYRECQTAGADAQ